MIALEVDESLPTPKPLSSSAMVFRIDVDRESDGRWLAAVRTLPGVTAYGDTREAAITKAEVLALRTLADRLDRGELGSGPIVIDAGGGEVGYVAELAATYEANRDILEALAQMDRTQDRP